MVIVYSTNKWINSVSLFLSIVLPLSYVSHNLSLSVYLLPSSSVMSTHFICPSHLIFFLFSLLFPSSVLVHFALSFILSLCRSVSPCHCSDLQDWQAVQSSQISPWSACRRMQQQGRVSHRSALHTRTSAPTWSTTCAQCTAAPPSPWYQQPAVWAPLKVRFDKTVFNILKFNTVPKLQQKNCHRISTFFLLTKMQWKSP